MITSAEQVAISRILEDSDLAPFLEASITEAFFASDRWKKAWVWVYEYWAANGVVPPRAAFTRNFPAWELADTDEPASAIIDELSLRRRRALVQSGIGEAVAAFDAEDVELSITSVQKMLATINTETRQTDVVSSSEFIERAIAEALKRRSTELLGIPTGFPTIDEATAGMQPEQLITLTALPKHGKSSIALAIAMHAQQCGYRGGVLTLEMANQEWMQRYMSIGAHVNLNSILRGRLTEQDKDALSDFQRSVQFDLPDLVLIHDVSNMTTVGSISAKMEQLDLDFIIIDGTYMMDDELGETRGSSQALTNITRSLKRMCQRLKKPVFNTTQSLQARVTRAKGVQVASIGYTSSFAQDSDTLLGLDRPDMELPQARLKVMAARSALGTETDIRIDYNSGYIEEMGGGGMQFGGSGGYSDDGD